MSYLRWATGAEYAKIPPGERTQLVGRAALQDTMKDLIVDVAGAAVSVLLGYLSSRRQQKR